MAIGHSKGDVMLRFVKDVCFVTIWGKLDTKIDVYGFVVLEGYQILCELL